MWLLLLSISVSFVYIRDLYPDFNILVVASTYCSVVNGALDYLAKDLAIAENTVLQGIFISHPTEWPPIKSHLFVQSKAILLYVNTVGTVISSIAFSLQNY